MSTEDISWKRLFASEFLSALREEWFSSYDFPVSIQVSNIKYKYLRSKYNTSFYPFNNQFDYALSHYFAKLETTKNNINKFLTDPLMTSLTKKLSYKNTDKQREKLSEISQSILRDKQTKYKFNIESGISEIVG